MILKIYRPAILLISLVICLGVLINQLRVSQNTFIHYSDPDFKELYNWTIANTENNQVAVTLDADLLINLPVYSPLNLYLPQAVLSPTPHQERYQRFYETVKIYGFNSDELREFIDKMLYNGRDLSSQKDYYGVNMALIDLVLFYGRYSHSKRTEEEKNLMISDFIKILNEDSDLSFKANFVILSTFDQKLVKEGSRVKSIITKSKPLFENNKYKVFKI